MRIGFVVLMIGAGLTGCVPAPVEQSGTKTPPSQSPSVAAAPIPTPIPTASAVSIRGCCRFTAPAGSAVSQPAGIPVDGYAQVTVTSGSERVEVSPYLGSYGWLTAQEGQSLMVAGHRARLARSEAEGTVLVMPLTRSFDGRPTPMSLQISSSCTRAPCPLFDAITTSLEIEEGWTDQSL